MTKAEIARRTGASHGHVSKALAHDIKPEAKVEKPTPDLFVLAMIAAGYKHDSRLAFPENICTDEPVPVRPAYGGYSPSMSSMEMF